MTHSPQMSKTNTKEAAGSSPLFRSVTNRRIAGVAGGLGQHFGVDPVWFRIAFVVLAIGGGSGILIYLVMWLIVPEGIGGNPASQAARGALTGSAVVGLVFIIVGTIALANTIAPDLGQYSWPVTLVVGGLALVMGGFINDSH